MMNVSRISFGNNFIQPAAVIKTVKAGEQISPLMVLDAYLEKAKIGCIKDTGLGVMFKRKKINNTAARIIFKDLIDGSRIEIPVVKNDGKIDKRATGILTEFAALVRSKFNLPAIEEMIKRI